MTVEQHQHVGGVELLRPVQGLAIGIGAAVVMAGVFMAGFALTGKGAWTPINAIGSFFQSNPTPQPTFDGMTSIIGLVIQLLVGSLLGVLYASAQARIDSPSLLIIAIWYGFIVWFTATFLILSWLKPSLREVMRSWPMLVSHLTYGAVLGIYAITQNKPVKRIVSPD